MAPSCGWSLSYLSPQGGHKFPRVGVRVVALHRVQLAAVVPPSDGVNVTSQDTDAVVGVLLLQGLDAAPAVVTGVVPGNTRVFVKVEGFVKRRHRFEVVVSFCC